MEYSIVGEYQYTRFQLTFCKHIDNFYLDIKLTYLESFNVYYDAITKSFGGDNESFSEPWHVIELCELQKLTSIIQKGMQKRNPFSNYEK